MDRRQLEYFIAIVDHAGFTNAAHVLHISQPSLSQSVKALERELGTELFYRVSRRVRLTPAGEALLGPARQAIRGFDVAAAAVLSVCDLQSGKLEVAALPSLAGDPLAELLGLFHARYPGVFLRILDPRGLDVLDLVRSGEAEIGFTWSSQVGTELETIRWGRWETYLALPPDYPCAQDDPLPLSVLGEVGLIVAPATKHLVLQLLSEHDITPRFALETDYREPIVPLILAGVGAALLPRITAAHARRLGATVRSLDPPLPRQLMLAHRRSALSPAAAAFVELVIEVLGQPTPAAAAASGGPAAAHL